VLEEAAKKRALTADEKSVLANKDEVLARAEVNAGWAIRLLPRNG
jgi:hypothetical protein